MVKLLQGIPKETTRENSSALGFAAHSENENGSKTNLMNQLNKIGKVKILIVSVKSQNAKS